MLAPSSTDSSPRFRRLERERDELRDAIERILAIVEDHLAE
jgi:hypothetical protein